MSTTTEDRTSSLQELMEGVPFKDLGNASELAPETPLTREAVVHLRAAALEIDQGFPTLRALVNLVRRRISPPAEVEVVLDYEEAYDLARTLDAVEAIASEKLVEPVFERGRGERPHGGIGDAEPAAGTDGLSLSEEEVWGLVEDLTKIGASADLVAHFHVDEEQAKNISAAVGALAEQVGDRLRRASGIPIDDDTDERLHDQATAWRDEAEKHGRDAVVVEEVER